MTGSVQLDAVLVEERLEPTLPHGLKFGNGLLAIPGLVAVRRDKVVAASGEALRHLSSVERSRGTGVSGNVAVVQRKVRRDNDPRRLGTVNGCEVLVKPGKLRIIESVEVEARNVNEPDIGREEARSVGRNPSLCCSVVYVEVSY